MQSKIKHTLVYYLKPNEKDVWFIQSESDPIEIDALNNIPDKSGFILYPFSSDSSCKPLFIPGNSSVVSNQWSEGAELTILPQYSILNTQYSILNTKTKNEYCKMVSDAVEEIKSGGLEKVVLSRLKSIKYPFINPVEIFIKLCKKYPSAFVSLVHIPGILTWLTATPELLISAKGNKIKTVSLAGTKPTGGSEVWGLKEIMEQQIVTDYINNILEKYCGNINVSDAKEDIAGNVKHLKSSFSATLKADLWSLVSALHPTPAVCGIPLNTAKEFIKKTEGYDRKYYTGFLGPCNMNGKTDLFVNLRCAEIFADGVNLYVGGGITKDSEPEKEWEETELKSKTLLFATDSYRHEK